MLVLVGGLEPPRLSVTDFELILSLQKKLANHRLIVIFKVAMQLSIQL